MSEGRNHGILIELHEAGVGFRHHVWMPADCDIDAIATYNAAAQAAREERRRQVEANAPIPAPPIITVSAQELMRRLLACQDLRRSSHGLLVFADVFATACGFVHVESFTARLTELATAGLIEWTCDDPCAVASGRMLIRLGAWAWPQDGESKA